MKINFVDTAYHRYENDFDSYTAGHWTVTVVGTGTAAIVDGVGGVLALATTNSLNDAVYLQKVGCSFQPGLGKSMYFESKFKISDATLPELVMGMQVTDTTPLAFTDGIVFQKAANSKLLDFHCKASSTSSDLAGIATLADDTYVTCGFYYDGVNRVLVFVNNAMVGYVDLTNVPAVPLTPSFGVKNGAAAAKTLSVDYVKVARER